MTSSASLTKPTQTGGEQQLNLDQFDSNQSDKSDDLDLKLEQFDNNNKPENAQSGAEVQQELNLDQFPKANESAEQINDRSANTTKIEKTEKPIYNHKQIFIVAALVLAVFLYFFSRRKRRRG